MLRKVGLLALVAVLAAGAVAIAGCGGDDKKEESTAESTPASSGATVNPDNPQIKAAIDSCKRSIDAQAQLSSKLRGELKAICDKAATGDVKAVQKASRDVCVKISEEMVPSGPAREQAVAACKQAVPGG